MKLAANQVRVFPPFFPRPGRRRLLFAGRRNTVQLLETALVIEGYRQRLRLPVIDLFFRQALSEWTTVTVPYSRIVRFRPARLLVARLLLALLCWLPALFVLLATVGELMTFNVVLWGDVALMALMALPALGLTLYVNSRLRSRYQLLFRRADGGVSAVALRIPSRKVRKAFAARLEENRRAAAAFTPRGAPSEKAVPQASAGGRGGGP
jgi:hypothetical protein